uniref:Uncharacterized protein n=1 Tax=Hanusia phi TaxID=3032 RepID=A0A7S0ESP7_9CRYP
MMASAAQREEAAFRRVEESEHARSSMEKEYRAEMLKFQSEVQKLHKKLDMRSMQEREEIARRVQGALDSVREAAENDIEEISRDRDHWQQECMKLEEEKRRTKSAQEHEVQMFKQQLATEGAKLAMARDENSNLSVKRNQDVSDLKSKLEMIVRQTKIKENSLQAEVSRLTAQMKSLQETFELEKSSIESDHCRQIEILQANNAALEGELDSMKQRVQSLQIAMEGRYRSVQENAQSLERAMDVSSHFSRQQADQNSKLLELVAQLQHERSLAESEIHFLRSDRERLLVEAEELQREIGRLDKLVYGKGSSRSKSKLKFPDESTNGIAWEGSRELLNGTILPNKSSSSSSFPRLAWQP